MTENLEEIKIKLQKLGQREAVELIERMAAEIKRLEEYEWMYKELCK